MTGYFRYLVVAIVLVIIGLFVVSSTGLFSLTEQKTIKLGVLLPLTGDTSSWGEPAKEALLLAQYEYNQNHNRKVEVIFEDDKCNPRDTTLATNKLVNTDGVIGVIGFACSGAAKAAIPILDNAKIPLIIVAASNPDLTKMSEFVFRVYPSDLEQGKFSANYIYNNLNQKEVVLLYENESWGKGIADVFKQNYNGKVLLEENFNTNDKDLTTILAKAKDINVDLIYFIAHPEPAMNVLIQVRKLGINTQVFGGDSFETDDIKNLTEAKGSMYSLAQISTPESFKQKIKEFSGYENGDFITAPLAYDAFWILTNAIDKANSIDGRAIVNELKTTNYKGISNHITFNSEGDISSAEFIVKTIQ